MAPMSVPSGLMRALSGQMGEPSEVREPSGVVREPAGLLGPPMPTDRWRAFWVATGVGLVAGVLRLWRLGEPDAVVFDETYYAKDAWALLRTGVEREWADDANERILAGDTSGLTDAGSFVSHPPFGKWVIAAGEALQGLTPLGWRLGVAVLGTLAAVVMVLLARRVTRSTALGGLAGLLVSLDGLAITTSRIAVLDGMLMFWIVLAAALLVRDRDAARAATARSLRGSTAEPDDPGGAAVASSGSVAVPLWRPWRLAMGVALGLACATKWSGVPVLAVFGLLTVVWQAGALADAGAARPVRRALVVDAPVAFVTVVGAAAATYLATWTGWLLGGDGYGRQWGAQTPASTPLADLVPDALRSLTHYHAVAYQLLAELKSDHNWASSPFGWLVLQRPVLFYRDRPTAGVDGCAAEQCVSDILALGTPLTWWLGVAAVALALWRAMAHADWRGWLVVGGVAATWLPWFAYLGRPVFSSYAVVTLPFLVLAIVLALRVLPDAVNAWGPAVATSERRWVWVAGVVLLGLTVAQAWYFWPIWVGEPLPLEQWRLRIWLPGWS
jgi:dolichyl-phosphate-mannose--protein O-mannosyl transferase